MDNPRELEKNLTELEMQLREGQREKIENLRQQLEQNMKTYTANNPWDALANAYRSLKSMKPNDRSEKDRRYAVAITKMEDVLAWFDYMVTRGGFD